MAWSFTLLSTTETTLIIVVILQEIATFISDRVAASWNVFHVASGE